MIQLNESVQIGPVLMAPLAGVTDRTFRGILTEQGADLTFTEMVSAKALHYQNENTRQLLRLAPNQSTIAVQLFGSDPDILAEIAASFEDRPEILLIDINMGCPAPKIVKNGEGSALMLDPERAQAILRAVTERTTKPVTCKFRRGYGMGQETALDFALRMEDAGASMITIHGRFRDQFYSGTSDRDIIRRVKQAVRIPVIGNGDIFTGRDAREMLETTGCDGIMVARGALGNPFIFQEIKAALDGRPYERPSAREILAMAARHLTGAIEDMGEFIGVREMRKHLGWYLKGMRGASHFRDRMNRAETGEEVIALLTELEALQSVPGSGPEAM
ncbi:putative tRNA-dihydrouridine synthase [anaerobic digester metagenome]